MFGSIITGGLGGHASGLITKGYGFAVPVKVKLLKVAEEYYLIEICPNCEITLIKNMYTVDNGYGKQRFCRHCHQELEYSSRGWIKKQAWFE